MSTPLQDKSADRVWDVIVIGSGMGGGVAGRRLAEHGRSVLFVEQGPAGQRGEQQDLDLVMGDPVARQVRGYWPTPIEAEVQGENVSFFGPIGSGVGGSSVFYAAALERPEPHDLDDTPDRPHPTGGWPVSYAEMSPYFGQVEEMFHVCGTPDPLGDGQERLGETLPARPDEDALIGAMQDRGLHPYRGHLALRHVEGCRMCLGFKCPKQCKMDGRSAGVEPALETGKAVLKADCRVNRFVGSGSRVDGIEVVEGGRTYVLRARHYVLAAGALSSPALLLNSRNESWPKGCANSSGLVGRNLMFHVNEMFALWPPKGTHSAGPTKSLALRDLYFQDGRRQGIVQAMGIEVRYGEIVYFLNMAFDRSVLRHLSPLRQLTRIPALIASKLFGNAAVFVGILEDLPYPENRVIPDPDRPGQIRFRYDMAPELVARHKAFRKQIRSAFAGMRMAFLNRKPELNYGHPCGTLKFGTNPAESVVDRDCKAHDLENLFVADASFMPTSCGTNPSLTIAANALRVADKLNAVLTEQEEN